MKTNDMDAGNEVMPAAELADEALSDSIGSIVWRKVNETVVPTFARSTLVLVCLGLSVALSG